LAEDYSGMTVGERLCAANLMDAFEAARAGGDLKAINDVLAKVGLRQDGNGMNWTFDNDA
jgi:hypothetical protein